MARHAADREDLWAEAVALTSRAELIVAGCPEPIVAGYRDNGWCSLYFGQDVMLQFTPHAGLRRAFRDGQLYRTQGTTLARLSRHRTDQESSLLRHDLAPGELEEFRAWVQTLVRNLQEAISSGRVVVRREVRTSPGPFLSWLEETLAAIYRSERFLAPPIAGKR